ncbi:hypothetical protein, partial [Treponema sp.]|uniref:hypothetical protein n=1 Tax=Treponema sp. TaxID=166 RepID=UPI003FA1FB6E
ARASYLYHLFAKALEIRHIYRQSYTSVYSFDYEFRVTAKHRFSDRMAVVSYSIEFFVYEKLAVLKCTWTYISEQWHPCRC